MGHDGIRCLINNRWGHIFRISGSAFLALIAAPLVGTPAGWAIIGVLIVTSLLMFFSQRGMALDSLIGADMEKFKETKNKLDKFEEINPEFDAIFSKKQRNDDLTKITYEYFDSKTKKALGEEKRSSLFKSRIVLFSHRRRNSEPTLLHVVSAPSLR